MRLLRASASKPRLPPLDPSETGPRNSSCDIARHSAPQADRLPDLLPDMNGRALAAARSAVRVRGAAVSVRVVGPPR